MARGEVWFPAKMQLMEHEEALANGRSHKKLIKVAAGFAITLLVIVATLSIALVYYPLRLLPHIEQSMRAEGYNPDSLGVVGDAFGLLNAIISALALLAVVYSLMQNSKALKDSQEVIRAQKSEMELSNKHFAAQRQEMEEQTSFYSKQLAANQFFQIFERFQLLADGLRIDEYEGKSALDHLETNITNNVQGKIAEDLVKTAGINSRNQDGSFNPHFQKLLNEATAPTSVVLEAYEHLYNTGGSHRKGYKIWLAHYLRFLFRLIEHINSRDHELIDVDEKYEFVRIIRAYLSQPELDILAVNSLTERGKRFKVLIDRYDLLNNIHDSLIWRSLKEEFPQQGGGEEAYLRNEVAPLIEKMGATGFINKASIDRLKRLRFKLARTSGVDNAIQFLDQELALRKSEGESRRTSAAS